MATIDCSRLTRLRQHRALSQRALAQAAGITRQAVGAIESGRMQPSVGIALALARALGSTVEDVFRTATEPVDRPSRIATAHIAGRTVAHALAGDHLTLEPAASPVPNVFLAGCDLAVGLLARHALARSHDVRPLWLALTNRAALAALGRREVHAAVVHGPLSAQRGEGLPALVHFEIATTQAGWLVAAGNPLGLRGAADLIRKKARIANRPPGAGARILLDAELRSAKLDPHRVSGYARELDGQLDAGRAIAQGFADTAVGSASVAQTFNLQFIALREERCVLVVPRTAAATPEIRALLDALRSIPFRSDLAALQAYDVTRTGERCA